MPVSLSIFGGFNLRVEGQKAPVLPRKARALLAFLAVQREQPVTREFVGELLWSDRGNEQVRHSLRQTLAVLRKSVGEQELVIGRDGALALGNGIQTDVSHLLELSSNSGRVQFQAAVDAYSGPLLDGFPPVSKDFDDWLSIMRAKFEATILKVLARLADSSTKAGDTQAALALTERMFAIDPLREDTHRLLLAACAAAGRRSEALRHYTAIVAMLRRELGVNPAKETRELAERLRHEMDPSSDTDTPPRHTVPAALAHAGSSPPIAVLPFRQIGDETIASHLAEGMVVDVICQLAGLHELRVISHGTSLGLKDPELDARTVGRMLGVRYVVTGAMRRSGGHLRLTIELADGESGMVIWARSHDTSARLAFDDQDRIVAQIVNTLAPRVHEVELRRVRGKRPETLTVYEKVLLARENLLGMDQCGFVAAKRLLDEAIEAEPHYAEPYALLADFHGLMAAEGLSIDRNADVAAVETLTRKALKLDSDNLRALTFYAHRKSLLQRDYAGAQELFRRALDISPSSAAAWLWSSYAYSWVADTNEALRRAYRALELSPRDRRLPDFYSAICTAHYTAGDFHDAAEWGLRALAERDVMRGTYRWTAASFAALGQLDRAREIMTEGMEKLPTQRVSDLMRDHPYRDTERRHGYCKHLLAAGFPD
jgi:DNA-binding SARP family transcriptional activator/TolB-like protein